VELQPLASVEHDVVVHRKRDGVLTGQPELALATDGVHPRLGGERIDEVGLLTLQTEDDGLDAAVAVPGGAE
jgi:hypothetical protein